MNNFDNKVDIKGKGPLKRSKWDTDDHVEEGDADELERQAIEARAKVAAKAARQRAKAAQRAKRNQNSLEKEESTSTPTRTTTTTTTVGRSSSSAGPSTPHHRQETAIIRHEPSSTSFTSQFRLPPVPPRSWHPPIQGCRSIHNYERLNHIEEGSYGVVFRAREKATGDIVALKKLKMDKERNGFPITSLREIRSLMEASHENVVRVREIVVGDTLTQIFIVMDFIEHDLKTLLSSQTMPFLASEIKTLLHQLLSAMSLLHRNWIIHRDLKTSNLLMNNRGQLKLADFGLARMYGEPRGEMTQLVVTLWYRAPELLLGATTYDTAIDMWSVGCIFAELMSKEPLFMGKNETDQITKIFRLLGQPNSDTWPEFPSLSNSKLFTNLAQPFSTLRQKFRYSTENCLDLLSKFLTYDPSRRITADEALKHPYFEESPAPAHPDSFGSFPSVAAGERKRNSPNAPERLADQKLAYQLEMDL